MGKDNKSTQIFLNDLGLINALGAGKNAVLDNLLNNHSPGMVSMLSPLQSKAFFVGKVHEELPKIPKELEKFECRNNQLALAAALQLEEIINKLKKQYSTERIGIVMGTSTSGIAEAELALKQFKETNDFPVDYHYKKQEIGAVAEFLARYFDIKGPAYSISTACSSSGKVFASARGLIDMDICDVVITGGADSLCELTLSGFKSLEAISEFRCNPFSLNRDGINIGEAAAVFIMSKSVSDIALLGVGEYSEAYHMSAPDPSGAGAKAAMQAALKDAGLRAIDIDYINLHGTATMLNDVMESHGVFDLFGENVYTSSTKSLTGHTLGAAGATEAGLCWLLLSQDENYLLPEHNFDGHIDPKLSKIQLCKKMTFPDKLRVTMSNSFAFGGNNVSVILGSNINV